MDAARLKFTKPRYVFITLRKFKYIGWSGTVKLLTTTWLLTYKCLQKTNQWDVKFLGATKRIKALQFVR